MPKHRYNAHTPPSATSDDWQELEAHLSGTADKAATLAHKLEAADWGYMAGLLHDLGKFRPEFQDYLDRCHTNPAAATRGEVPHSAYGALKCEGDMKLLWPIIAGHHSSIYQLDDGKLANLKEKYEDSMKSLPIEAGTFVQANCRPVTFPKHLFGKPHLVEPFIRFLFSCLIEADIHDSADHESKYQEASFLKPSECLSHFESCYEEEFSELDDPVARMRRGVFEDCVGKASLPKGLFRVTAPTGTGKTLATLAFALHHAEHHRDIARVVYAAPYTSIIDQNVGVYRRFLPEGSILEHHSGVDPEDTEDQTEDAKARREATQRWDHPFVLTTSVQLFESLFASKRSKCRKLHNVANSVIILDEVQALPPHLMIPTVKMIGALAEVYGCTVLLCTATQPALGALSREAALPPCQEMIKDVPTLFKAAKRVEYEIERPTSDLDGLIHEVLKAQRECGSVLVVTNTKKLAVAIWRGLKASQEADFDLWHLSTLLHPAHRKQIIHRLQPPLMRPTVLISTQVVEAGVDLDFPTAYREFGPLDRIVQAAGRCNRNGVPGQAPFGKVVVFGVEGSGAPQGDYQKAIEASRAKLAQGGDLHDPDLYERFFRLFYGMIDPDKKGIEERRKHFDFPEVARRYKMIDEDTVSLVIEQELTTDKERAKMLAKVKAKGFASVEEWQKMQPYSVSLRESELAKLERARLERDWIPGLHLWRGGYHPDLGMGETVEMAVEDLTRHG